MCVWSEVWKEMMEERKISWGVSGKLSKVWWRYSKGSKFTTFQKGCLNVCAFTPDFFESSCSGYSWFMGWREKHKFTLLSRLPSGKWLIAWMKRKPATVTDITFSHSILLNTRSLSHDDHDQDDHDRKKETYVFNFWKVITLDPKFDDGSPKNGGNGFGCL